MFENISGIEIFLYVAIFVTVVLLLVAKLGKISQRVITSYGLLLSIGFVIYLLFTASPINYRYLDPPRYETGVLAEKITDKEAVKVVSGLEKRIEYLESELEKTRSDLSNLSGHYKSLTNMLATIGIIFLISQLLGVRREGSDRTDSSD